MIYAAAVAKRIVNRAEGTSRWLIVVPCCPFCSHEHTHEGGALERPGAGRAESNCGPRWHRARFYQLKILHAYERAA